MGGVRGGVVTVPVYPTAAVRCAADGYDTEMERGHGDRLEMDEDKRQQLDQQAEEYVDDVPEMPAMNAEPPARYPDSGTAEPADTAEPPAS
jgi:hypothetical protein